MLIHLLAQTSTTQPADPFQLWLILAAMIFGSVMAMVWVWQKLYKRTSPEIALVRTGMNGMKIGASRVMRQGPFWAVASS